MKYKLYESGNNDTSNVLREVLKNRGIVNYEEYLNLDSSVVIPYQNLDNIKEAVDLFMKHFNNFDKISILVDSDPDGYCSAAMMYLYIKKCLYIKIIDREYPIEYVMHKRAKTHGLSDDVTIPSDTKLLIIPDAGTNDTLQCKKLSEQGMDILILDHHEREVDNPYALIVNNQTSEGYPNKDLCGAGVVYRFLQALDDENWTEYADDYLDLCALANISDVMDMRSYETRYFVNLGLLNIKNKFLDALIKEQDYSMNGKVNVHNVQWYLTPVLNGMIRVGSLEEKELLFKAFIEQDEYFEYKKRATKDRPAEVIQESIYDRAARLSKNAKSRQDKQKEKSVKQIAEIVEYQNSDNKVTIVDTSEILESGLTGVVAIKIAEIFNKPCILLHKFINGKSGDKFLYGGSGRNINHSPIENFKDIVNETGIAEARGHGNAFGVINLKPENLEIFSERLNEILKDVEYDSTYKVDFILHIQDMSVGLIHDLSVFDDIIGQGIDEPMVAVENIILEKEDIEVFGKNEDTISFTICGIKYIQFRCKEGNGLYDFVQNAWDNDDVISINIVGKPSINEYEGVRTPQVIIEDVNVLFTDSNSDDDIEW